MRFFLALLLGVVGVAALTPQEELIAYVNAPDDSFAWEDTGFSATYKNILNNFEEFEFRMLNLTSQTWMDGLVRPSIWTHQLAVIIPKEVQYTNMSMIYVTGGHQHAPVPGKTQSDLLAAAYVAQRTNTISAVLYQIPNAPTSFKCENFTIERSEDHLLAFSWMQYIRSVEAGDPKPEWNALFPMAKSVSAAMTAVTEYTKKAGLAQLDQTEKPFVIAGASKRGWTTWLAGASDKRIAGIIPIVMDMLNFTQSIQHMTPAYGGWSFAFQPYIDEGFVGSLLTPGFNDLVRYLDPLNYKQYLKMPKLVVDATGDEFFMPDDDWFWWGDLEGETYRLIASNAEHSEITGIPELLPSLSAFALSIINPSLGPRPTLDWTFDKDAGIIVVTSKTMPQRVVVHRAKSDDGRRDFRLVRGYNASNGEPCAKKDRVNIFGHACINLGELWSTEDITASHLTFNDEGDFVYTVNNPAPAEANQWAGALVELIYPRPFCLGCDPFIFTTQISIMPNTFPFPAWEKGKWYPVV